MGHRTRQAALRCLPLLIWGTVLPVLAACGAYTASTTMVPEGTATETGITTPSRSPRPQYAASPLSQYAAVNAAQAIQRAMPHIVGDSAYTASRLGHVASWRIQSVQYVETTVSQLGALFDPTTFTVYPQDATAWVFVASGEFTFVDRQGQHPSTHATTVEVVVYGYPGGWGDYSDNTYDLSLLGTPVSIEPGEYPEIDRRRTPLDATPAPGTATPAPDSAPLVPDSPSATCCSLQLDMDPATPGVQADITVTGQPDISIDVVLGDDVGELGAFDFKLVYDDTRLAPLAGGSGLDGNPDFNEVALGTAWTCGPSPSGQPDIDPDTGPGHGVAFISCYVTGQPPALAAPTAIATLRLHFLAAGDASIDIAEANFAHYDATDIGSCNPVNIVEMACAGGSVSD